MSERPESACITHRPPREGESWRLIAVGYYMCGPCQDRLTDWLLEIPSRYSKLDPSPGSGGDGRRGPGFASQPAANLHIVSLTDMRTTQVSPGGVQSVPGIISSWAQMLIEERSLTPSPPHSVSSLCALLRAHLDYCARQPWVDELYSEIGELRNQLRTATGEPRPAIVGRCTKLVDDSLNRCKGPLRMGAGEQVRCGTCGTTYSGLDLVRVRLVNEKEAS